MRSELSQVEAPADELYSLRQASRRLNISRKTIWREITRGNLKAFKVGNGVTSPLRIAESEIQRYLADHRAQPNPEAKA